MMLTRVIAGRGAAGVGASNDEKPGAVKRAAPTAITDLCDLYTQSGIDGKYKELLKVYDQRRNDDNLREILALSAPTQRVTDLTDWHLERMAVSEYGDCHNSANVDDVAAVKREVRHMKQTVRKVLANAQSFQARRDALVDAMARQRDALTTELDAAKDFLNQIHLTTVATDPNAISLSTPAPVEQRLRATVKAPEAAASVDLSAAPAI